MRVVLRSRACGVVTALGALLIALDAGAAVWPGAAPCNGTLQACIDAVAPGAVVEIANAVANENLSITKNLTLRPAAGKIGVIGGSATPRAISVGAGAGGATVDVKIRDLTLDNAIISMFVSSGSGHEVSIRGCSIRNEIESNNVSAVDLNLRVPATVTVEYNDIESNGDGIGISSLLAGGSILVVARGNRITSVVPALSGNGIDVDLRGAGSVAVDLHNNAIYGVSGCNCGGAAGIQVGLLDTVSASLDIINNTLDDLQVSSPGISVRTPEVGTSAAINVFNNIVTRATEQPVVFPAVAGGLLISSGFNDFYDNALAPSYGGYPAGAGVISVAPGYVNAAAGNYRVQGSQVIDAGTAVPPGGLPTFDADGKARTIGAFPDLGAYEAPEPGAAGCAAVIAATLAGLSLRRRRDRSGTAA